VMLLPVGACDDGAHSQNEKFDRANYQNGIKVRVLLGICLLFSSISSYWGLRS